MKDVRFNALLVAARPKGHRNDDSFTDKVMDLLEPPEILSSAVRSMNVTKKETFMTKIKRLPAFALIAIVIGATLLLSGSAYAAYQLLWQKPEVHVSAPEQSVSGRDEVVILLKQCGDSTLASRYELKKNATITAAQVAGVVQARCELDAIGTWAMNTFPHDERFAPSNAKEHDSIMLDTSFATHIKSRSHDSITFTGLTKYNQPDKTYTVNKDTRFVVDGHDVAPEKIGLDDPVVYITTETYRIGDSSNCGQSCSVSSEFVGTTLHAVVKLSMPFENYDQLAWQSLTERTTCAGNPNDSCLTGFIGGIDLYTGSTTSELGKTEMKEIQGTVTQLDGKSVVIKSSSGSIFTITTPTDVISTYNTHKAGQYNNQAVKIGSTLRVSYVESADQHAKTLHGGMLMSVYLQTETVGKGDLPAAY